MSINLAKSLKAKRAELKLSLEALAKAIGVSTISVRGVLSGKSQPNAATAGKYAAFLGIDAGELTGSAAKTKKKGKRAAKAAPAKRGRKPGKAAKGKRGPGKRAARASAAGLGGELITVVSAAAAVLDDALAVAVHQASKGERELVARLLAL